MSSHATSSYPISLHLNASYIISHHFTSSQLINLIWPDHFNLSFLISFFSSLLIYFQCILPHIIWTHLTYLTASLLISPHCTSSYLIHIDSPHLTSITTSYLMNLISTNINASQIISDHLTSSQHISSYLISPQIISTHLISSHLISPHPISLHFTLPHLILSHLISFHITKSHVCQELWEVGKYEPHSNYQVSHLPLTCASTPLFSPCSHSWYCSLSHFLSPFVAIKLQSFTGLPW